jgi:hypothetical protein
MVNQRNSSKVHRFALVALAFTLLSAGQIFAAGPDFFTPAIWGDGQLWATKGVAVLPPPNGHNNQSYDILFVIINSNNPNGQLPVSEAAPRNFNYNGGRWFLHTVEWTQAGFDAHGTVPVLTSYDEVILHYDLGHLSITEGSPDPVNGPPDYLECPLLPLRW